MNIIKWAILPTLLLAACAPSQTTTPQETPSVQASPAPQNNPQKAAGVWIDVRSAEEYQAGHLSDTVNIPHEQIGAKIASVAPDKNTPIHLYCRSGRRSEMALQELKKLGYTNLTNHGGYDDLVKQGLK